MHVRNKGAGRKHAERESRHVCTERRGTQYWERQALRKPLNLDFSRIKLGDSTQETDHTGDHNCRVYAAGGMGSDLRPQCFLQQFDMLKDIWVHFAPMPTPRYGATSFLRGSKIYVLGGRQSKYAVNAFEVFDTDSRSWTKFPSIPNKRAYSRYVISEGSLYSLGGLRQGGTYRRPKFTKTVDIFDMEQGGWMKTDRSCFLRKRRADFVAGAIHGRVVVAGGLGNQPSVLETTEIFHPLKNRWENLSPMPNPRCACATMVLKNRLYAIGGVNQGPSSAVDMLSLIES
ncbi:kelch domain-containing protein 8A isoform X2 [Dendrobates tinctorius]|uniref:kelch domain-containing protein 8A isoform X2 n=1 Tax=Dendrobates tinctorius TaxID=92724 RepID=UPI003CC9C81A